MADGVTVDNGGLTDIALATDDAGASGHVQIIKLAISTDGSATLLPADATYGLDADVTRIPAADESTDAITVKIATDKLMNDLTALTPKFAKANVAQSQTDSSIVAAVTSKKIRVVAFLVRTGGTATNITFNTKPAGAGTAISPLLASGANGGAGPGFCPVGWFETNAGEGLTVTTGAGSTTGVLVVYVEV